MREQLLFDDAISRTVRGGLDDETLSGNVPQNLPGSLLPLSAVARPVPGIPERGDRPPGVPRAAQRPDGLLKCLALRHPRVSSGFVGLVVLALMFGDAGGRPPVARLGGALVALLPVRIFDDMPGHGVLGAVPVGVEEVGDTSLVLEGDKRGLGCLVVALGEELSEAGFLPASAPAFPGGQETGLVVARHELKVAGQDLQSRVDVKTACEPAHSAT
jgi:hypothetical protein